MNYMYSMLSFVFSTCAAESDSDWVKVPLAVRRENASQTDREDEDRRAEGWRFDAPQIEH